MKVGVKHPGMQSSLVVDRTQQTLNHAISKLKNSTISPLIEHVYLYGSCDRKTQNWGSDVDLLVELSQDVDIEKYKSDIIQLKGSISPVSLELPNVDLHFVVGNSWRKDKLPYYQNVRKEGIDVWDDPKIHI